MGTTAQAVAITLNVLFLVFMVASGLWVGIDAHKRGRPLTDSLLWGIFSGWFIGLGLILYLKWGRHLNQGKKTE